MGPLDRKLFKSRDARNTLRGMGGIVASSPELAQTVAKYKEGGRVTGLEQMEMDPIRDGRATRIGGRDFVMLPNGVVLDARTQMPASPEETLAVQRRLNAFPERDPAISEEALAMRVNPSFATDMRDRGVGIGVSDRMPAAPEPTSPATLSAATDPAIVRAQPSPMSGGFLDVPPAGGPDPLRSMSPERLKAERMAVESGGIPEFATDVGRGLTEFGMDTAEAITGTVRGAGETLQRGLGEGLSTMGLPGPGAFFLEGAERTADLSQTREEEERARDAANAEFEAEREARRQGSLADIDTLLQTTTSDLRDDQKAARGFDRLAGAPAPAPAAEEDGTVDRAPVTQEDETAEVTTATTAAAADTEAAAGTATSTPTLDPEEVNKLMPSPEDTEDDIRAKYKQRLELFQEVLGEDEAGARNKAMDLAMIGLAIASGQSPDALTNIAQGTLTGLQAMSARDEAARERERLIKTTAFETVLEDEAAAAAAEAEAAEAEADRLNALEVARIRSAGTSGALSTKAQIHWNNTYQNTLNAERDRSTRSSAVKKGELTPHESAVAAADAALKAFEKNFGIVSTTEPSAGAGAVDPGLVQRRIDELRARGLSDDVIKRSFETDLPGIDASQYGL